MPGSVRVIPCNFPVLAEYVGVCPVCGGIITSRVSRDECYFCKNPVDWTDVPANNWMKGPTKDVQATDPD